MGCAMDNLLRTKEKKRFKDWLLMALGWLLVILGVLGLFLPFLQGVLFITLGAALLSRVSPRMKRWGENIKERFGKLRNKKRSSKSE